MSRRLAIPSRARTASRRLPFLRTTVVVAAFAVTVTSGPSAFAAPSPSDPKPRNAAVPQAKPPAPMPRAENLGTAAPVRSSADASAARRSTPPVPSREAHPTELTAPDEASALALAAEKQESVEVTGLRKEGESVLARPDGTMTLQAYAGPVRIKDGAGWRDVDTSLVFDAGTVRPRGAKGGVRFSAGGRGDLARIGSADHSYAVEWPGALPVPALRNDTATYRNVLPGVDLTLRATRQGYEQNLVLRERPATPLVIRMPVRLHGLRMLKKRGGEIALVDARGRAVAQATRPEMWGATIDPRTGDSTQRAEVATTVRAERGTTVLELRPDPAFLARAAFPVTIDPNPALTNVGDTWVETSYVNTAQMGSTELKSGTYDSGGHKARSFLKFSTSGITGKHVISSQLSLYNFHSYSCQGGTTGVTLRRTLVNALTSGFDSSTVWGNQPNWTTANGAYSDFAYGYNSTACPANWARFTNMGPMAAAWAAGTANYGIVVRGNSETDSYVWRRYYSANHGTYVPQLTVNYNSYPNLPSNHSPLSTSTIHTLTPSLSAVVSDPDANTVRGVFDIYNNATGAAIATTALGTSVASGSRSSYTIASGKLAYNTTYKWRVRTKDSVGDYSGYIPSTGYFTFTPTPGTFAPSAPGVDVVTGDGSATVTWTEPADDGGAAISGYKVYVYPNACVSAPTSTGAFKYYSITGNLTFSQPVTGLSNGTAYCFHVTASNSAGQSTPGTEIQTPHGLAQIAKTVAGNGGVSQPLYAFGQTVTYTVTVTNPETAGSMAGVRFSDTIPDALSLVPDRVWLNGAACAATCLLDGTTFDFALPTLNAGQSATIAYQATIPHNEALDCIGSIVNSATATNGAGVSTATSTINACNSGLGMEPWWSYVSTPLGPQATAATNVANGNLVISATDATPVQQHGRLALVLRRSYNSREATLATLPGSLGAGWQFNVGQTSDLAADGVGTTGLYVPSAESIAAPLSVAMIDRDGTRHVFSPNTVSLNVLGTGVSTAMRPTRLALDSGYPTLCIDQTYDAPQGVHLGLWRYVETTASSCDSLVNSSSRLLGFAAVRPDRVRYEYAATGQLLSMLDGAGNRLDYVYDNQPVGIATDALSGLSLNLGNLRAVYDPRACTATASPVTLASIPAMCRAMRFYYPSATEMVVYDGATRLPETGATVTGRAPTRYYFDTPAAGQPKHLIQVLNPTDSDNSVSAASVTPSATPTNRDRIVYKYGTQCAGSNANPNQLCSVSSQRDATTVTSFTYTSPPTLLGGEMPKIASITDRHDLVTSFTYSDGTTVVDANPGQGTNTHRRTYSDIDGQGRVGDLAEGDASGGANSTIGRTYYTWDGRPDGDADVRCESPGGKLDNHLCLLQRESGSTTSPDQESSFLYNDEGAEIASHQCLNTSIVTAHVPSCVAPSAAAVSTTNGYSALYYLSDGTVSGPYTDSVAGSGTVTSSGPRPITGTLFAVSDRVESLGGRGNEAANAASLDRYRTTYTVDNVATVAPNTPLTSGGFCTAAGAATGNSGLVCASNEPGAEPVGTAPYLPRTTRYTFDRFGQRATMATPEAVATNSTATYTYTYFTDQTAGHTDRSGLVYAGGWLRSVRDPLLGFVAFVYDAAGNVVRTYDRDATHGKSATSFAGTGWTGAAPAPKYSETTYGPANAPWRYPLTSTDALGNTTTYDVDQHGNQEHVTSPRGNVTTQNYDKADLLIDVQRPADASTEKSVQTYDEFGRTTVVTDPLGHKRSFVYDAKGRKIRTYIARGPASTTTVPSGCTTSAAAPVVGFPASPSVVYCTMSLAYDLLDDVVSETDGSGQTVTHRYDGLRRKLRTDTPRNDGTVTTLRTETVYDAEGHVLVSCPPRQNAEGGACVRDGDPGGPSYYSTYNAYDYAGRVVSTKVYRSTSAASAIVTTHAYDADGNETATVDGRGVKTTFTYDLLDRKKTQVVPRSLDTAGNPLVTSTTTWRYSDAGDVIGVFAPGEPSDNPGVTGSVQTRITGFAYDAAHRRTDSVRALQVTGQNPENWSVDNINTAIANAVTTTTTNQRTRNVYDQDGHVVRVYDARAFTGAGTTAAPLNDYSVVTDYDANGRAKEQFVPRSLNSNGVADVTQCAPGQATTDRGYSAGTYVCRTLVTYDATDHPSRVQMPTFTSSKTNRYMDYEYTDDGLMKQLSGPDPASDGARRTLQTRTYDGAGRLITDKNALNQTSSTVYWPDGLVREVNNAAGSNGLTHQVRHVYDANGNEITTVFPRTSPTVAGQTEDDSTVKTYTPDNLLASSKTNGPGTFGTDFSLTTYTYDKVGNTIEVMSPSGNAGDANNHGALGVGTVGTATRNTFTPDNLLQMSEQPVAVDGTTYRRSAYSYDKAGRKTMATALMKDPAGNTIAPAGPSAQIFTYTPLDQLKTQQGRANSGCITTDYDAAGHVTSISDLAAAACGGTGTTTTLTATYLLDGLLASVTDGSRTSTLAYDGAARLGKRTETASTGTESVTYTNNDAGLTKSIASTLAPTAATVAYNAIGQPVSRVDANGQTVTWAYDTDGALKETGITSPGGSANDTAKYSYTYDEQFRKLTQTYTGKDASALHVTVSPVTYTYQYNPAGQVSSFSSSALGSLAKTATWDHDGNRKSYGTLNWTYRADDSILTGPSGSTNTVRNHTIDVPGRLTSDGCTTSTYDGFDRLKTSVDAGGNDCGSDNVTYAYDGIDRQISRTVPGTGQTTVTTTFAYSGLSQDLVSESDPNGRTEYADDASGLPFVVRRGSTTQYLTDDGTGSIATVTNGSGVVACTARYDAFGSPSGNGATAVNTSCNSGSTISNVFYRGGRKDEATGSYQMGSRTYDPAKGTFLTPDSFRTQDPAGDLSVGTDPLTANRYSYVNGDAVNLDDPSGHRPGCDENEARCAKQIQRHTNTQYRQMAAQWHEQRLAEQAAERQLEDKEYARALEAKRRLAMRTYARVQAGEMIPYWLIPYAIWGANMSGATYVDPMVNDIIKAAATTVFDPTNLAKPTLLVGKIAKAMWNIKTWYGNGKVAVDVLTDKYVSNLLDEMRSMSDAQLVGFDDQGQPIARGDGITFTETVSGRNMIANRSEGVIMRGDVEDMAAYAIASGKEFDLALHGVIDPRIVDLMQFYGSGKEGTGINLGIWPGSTVLDPRNPMIEEADTSDRIRDILDDLNMRAQAGEFG